MYNAAATFGLRSKVSALLEMRNPLLTYTSSCKETLFYSLQSFNCIEDSFTPLLKSLIKIEPLSIAAATIVLLILF